jgi:hypothetical protein
MDVKTVMMFTVVGNRIYSSGEEIPGLQVNLISTDTRDDISLSSASVNRTYTVGVIRALVF